MHPTPPPLCILHRRRSTSRAAARRSRHRHLRLQLDASPVPWFSPTVLISHPPQCLAQPGRARPDQPALLRPPLTSTLGRLWPPASRGADRPGRGGRHRRPRAAAARLRRLAPLLARIRLNSRCGAPIWNFGSIDQ
jgi:hypothetical protein